MGGLASVCIGRRKTGKTTLTKRLLEKSKLKKVIYDINQEYKDFYDKPFVDFNVFLDKIVELKNSHIVIEEATIFFRQRSQAEQMINLLVRARHTGNIIQLNFHSFKSVPKDIYNLLDYVTILKTNDSLKDVKDKFDNKDIIKAFEEARESKNPYFNKTVSLY